MTTKQKINLNQDQLFGLIEKKNYFKLFIQSHIFLKLYLNQFIMHQPY